MKCSIINPKTGRPFNIGERLKDIFNIQDLEVLKKRFSHFTSESFMNDFGNWNNPREGEDFTGRVDAMGEPLLKKDKYGNYFYINKFSDKIFINNRRFEGLDRVGIKELTELRTEVTNQISAYIFSKHFKDNDFDDMSDITFSILEEVDNFFEYATNQIKDPVKKARAKKTYDFLASYRKDWRDEVIDFYEGSNISYSEVEDADDSMAQDEKSEKGLGVDLRVAAERNSKDNATAKIKLLLSFLPEVNEKGRMVIGKYVPVPKMLPFSKVWYDLETTLSDIPKTSKGNEVTDPLSVILERLEVLKERKPYFKAVISKLNGLDENGKTQFVQAFANLTVNHADTVEIEGDANGSRVYKRINAAETNNKSNQILGEWGNIFRDKYFIERGSGSVINVDLLIDKLNSSYIGFTDTLTASRKLFRDFSDDKISNKEMDLQVTELVNATKQVLNDVGINISEDALGYYLSDMGENSGYTMADFFKNMIELENGISYMIGAVTKDETSLIDKAGEFMNPYLESSDSKQVVISNLAKAEGFFNQELSENTYMAASKNLWKHSLSTLLNDKVQIWKKDTTELEKISNTPGTKNSVFAKEFTENPNKLSKVLMTSTMQEEGKSAEGTDNTTTSKVDAINRDIFEVLGHTFYGGLPSYQTPVPADKSTAMKLEVDYFIKSGARMVDGNFKVNKKVLDIFAGYIEDVMGISLQAMEDISQNTDSEGTIATENLTQYHHANKNGFVLEVRDRNNKVLEEFNNSNLAQQYASDINKKGGFGKVVMAGNAFKNSIIPSMSFDVLEKNHPGIKRGMFYKSNGLLINNNPYLTASQRIEVDKIVTKSIQDSIDSIVASSKDYNIIKEDGGNNNIDSNVFRSYKGDLNSLFGDYFVNSAIAQVEYSKLFSGDISFFKTETDYFKRIPGTYISGQALRLGVTPGDHLFNVAIINDAYVASPYTSEMPEHIARYYGKEYKENGKTKRNLINQADAQSYITPERWKFLLERLGKWSTKHDVLYEKMLTDDFSANSMSKSDIKLLSAQPLKGVYRSLIDGRPVYLKYSQAVLLPGMIAGSPLQRLAEQMKKQDVQEAVMNSGIKVGANIVRNITEDIEQGNDFTLDPIQLDNRNWKLQQDLPTKLYKDTLVGSQIQKNIFNSIDFAADYNGKTGAEIFKQLHNTTSALSDKGLESLIDEFGIDEDFVINDWEGFAESIVEQLKQEGIDEDILTAIQKELTPYVLPQARTKILNTIFSIINKRTVKIKTNGGSLIQMSNFGLSSKEANEKGIYWLKDPETLAEPRLIKDKDGKSKVLSGQVFINASFISEIVPDWRVRKPEELFGAVNPETGRREGGLIDARALDIVGYRIPNQGTSSNDPLEVVGILPEYFGDKIVTYTGITTKTGSDFDIDKMFIMMPHMKATYKFESISKKGYKFIEEQGYTDRQILSIMVQSGYNRDFLEMQSTKELNKVFITDILFDNQTKQGKLFEQTNETEEKELLSYDYVEYDAENPTKKGLQNRLLELYLDVLKAPTTYDALMTPLDFPFMEDDITDLYDLDNKTFSDLETFSPLYQIETKYSYLAGQFGIGQLANQLVDHMRGQAQENSFLNTNLGWGNRKTVTRNKRTYKITLLDKNENGEFISERTDGLEPIPINNSLSAVLNGFVDIANKPFITTANWNTMTSNMGSMLLRAGVHPFKVNAFLGQDSLRKLVVTTNTREGILKDPSEKSTQVLDELVEEYTKNLYRHLENTYLKENNQTEINEDNVERYNTFSGDIVSKLMSESFNKVKIAGTEFTNRVTYYSLGELRNSIKKPEQVGTLSYDIMQLLALKEYGTLNELAKIHRLSVSSSKMGEAGAGINPTQALISLNNVASVMESRVLMGYRDKYVDGNIGLTLLGTYYNNSVAFVNKLIQANPKLFLTAGKPFKELYDDISINSNNSVKYLKDEYVGKLLEEHVYTGIMSDFGPFKLDNKKEEYKYLFGQFGNEIESLKKTSNNFLINELEVKKENDYNFIGINGGRIKPKDYMKKIKSAWLDIHYTDRDLSMKLLKYSFYQSGFRNNISAIHKFIPHELFIESKLNGHISRVAEKPFDIYNYETVKDQIYRHNAEDTKIVPFASKADIIQESASKNYFTISPFSDKFIQRSEEGDALFPPFMSRASVTYKYGSMGEVLSKEVDTHLFKLEGYLIRDGGIQPYYFRTHKLGHKTKKGQFQEYNFSEQSEESFSTRNNLTEEDFNDIERIKKAIKDSDVVSILPNDYSYDMQIDTTVNNMSPRIIERFGETKEVNKEVEEVDTQEVEPVNFYEGDITPDENTVFVFGSNPIGVNGNPAKGTGGAALVAQNSFGVSQGEKMDNKLSESGKAYGLTTVTGPGKRRSISPKDITEGIKKLYNAAMENPSKDFKVAYRNTTKASLNGYTGIEMIDMFIEAGAIPDNVVFSKEWIDTGKFEDTNEENDKDNCSLPF